MEGTEELKSDIAENADESLEQAKDLTAEDEANLQEFLLKV